MGMSYIAAKHMHTNVNYKSQTETILPQKITTTTTTKKQQQQSSKAR